MDTTESLGISQSELERNKFSFLGIVSCVACLIIPSATQLLNLDISKAKKHDLMMSMMIQRLINSINFSSFYLAYAWKRICVFKLGNSR